MLGNIYKNNFNPEHIALKYKDQTITYGQLDEKVSKYATFLSKKGVKKGDKVVLSCLNSPEFIYSYLGIVKLGAIVVPINLLLTLDEMVYVVKNSEAKTMIVHPTILAKLKQGKSNKKKAISWLVEKEISRAIIGAIIGIDLILIDDKFKKTIDSITENKFEEVDDEELISTFLYTSGTTGKPKAAILTHHNLIANTIQSSKAIDLYSEDNFICVLPMFHAFAFTVCVLLPLYSGSTISIIEMFQPKEVMETLLKEGITIFAGVPSMYVVLLDSAKNNITFPKLRLAVSGGASLPNEVLRQVKENLNIPILEGYGLSEASPVVSFNPVKGSQKEGSVGLPLTGIKCRVVNENGEDVKVGEVGELIVQGENVMQGYYKHEEQTKETLKDGWLYTGDLVKIDEEGYIYIVDRKKDMVIVGGLNVYPREVEEALYKYPRVKECAVIGVNDNLRGEYVKAFVVLKDSEPCHSKEILRFLKEKIALYKLPREIEFVNELPKNATGKIMKKLLK